MWYNESGRLRRYPRPAAERGWRTGRRAVTSPPGCDYEGRRYPDVAYNSGHQQYLVVWQELIRPTFPASRAATFGDRRLLLDLVDLTIQGGSNLYTPSNRR